MEETEYLKVVLGSESPNRKKVVGGMGIPFEVMKPGIDEKSIRSDNPAKLCMALARAKNDALRGKVDDYSLLITADQVVFCNGKIYEKPENNDEIRRRLKIYARHPVMLYNAITVCNTANNMVASGVEIATLSFKDIADEIVEQFINEGTGMVTAGGFSIHSKHLEPYIQLVEGTIDGILGLPLYLLEALIDECDAHI